MVSIAYSQKLLGNVDITPYIGTIPIIAESKQTELESLVLQQRKATEGRIYDIEKNLLVTLDTHIKQELIRSCYAPISLEFLRTSQEKDYEGKMFPDAKGKCADNLGDSGGSGDHRMVEWIFGGARF